jgi:hypothetical protein
MKTFQSWMGVLVGWLGLGLATMGFAAAGPGLPQMGPHVLIFTPQMKAAAVQVEIDRVYAEQEHSEFGSGRYALVFLPGTYRVDVPVGFYTEVMGLGATPDAVRIVGSVHADASLPHNNATCTFWRSLEGLAVTPSGGTMQWAVSQAAPFRRMHVEGSMALHQQHGWASGGWMADVLVDGNVDSGSQQQWMARNSDWGSWTGASWNMVFVGDRNMPAGEWPKPPYTKVEATPVVREKPFLMVDEKGAWSVRVPEVRRESVGVTWRGGATPGRSIPLERFYLALAGKDTAATMNAALARGMHLLLTPGIYELEQPLRVTRAGTVVMGLGFATLRAVKGTAALTTADVDGVDIAGVLVDAGETKSPVLMEVGEAGSRRRHAANPICLHDVFFRVGGAGAGSAGANLVVNSRDTIIDHTWIWRADHGKGVGWTVNPSDNGLVVNGDNVTAYGLFVEHHEQFQVLWKGEGGRTYFYQSEIPYDPPDQASYASAPGTNGWASYKVADGVTTHEAWGLGVYSVFLKPQVTLTRAIETPRGPGIRFHDMMTVALGNLGAIEHVIDDAGGATSIEPRVTPRVTAFP